MATDAAWLSESQWSAMRAKPPLAVLATADTHGRPHTSVVSWLVVPDREHIQLAVDTRGQHFRNIEHNPRLTLQILGDDLLLAIGGTAGVVRERLEQAPFPISNIRIDIDSVVDQTLPDMRFHAPSYQFPPDKADRKATEAKVLRELARASDLRPMYPVSLLQDP